MGEVANLEQDGVGLNVLALVGRPVDDRAGGRSAEGEEGLGFAGFFETGDVFVDEAEGEKFFAGVGEFGSAGGEGAGLETFKVETLGGEDIGAVERAERLA